MIKPNRILTILLGSFICLPNLLLPNFFPQRAVGQLLEPVADTSSREALIPMVVGDVYQLTRTAKSTADFELIVENCHALLATELNDKDRKYLDSLVAWSENRCAEKLVQNSESMLEMGLNEQGNQQLQLAVEKYDVIIKSYPLTWRAWMGRAVLHAKGHEYELALEKFRQVTKLNNRCLDARFNCAEIEFHLQHYNVAIDDYTRLIDEDPTDVQSRTGRGHCYMMLGDPGRAVSDFQTVVDLYPENSVALVNVGEARKLDPPIEQTITRGENR